MIMYSVAHMEIEYKLPNKESWETRKLAFVFNDLTDIDTVMANIRTNWELFLKVYKEECENQFPCCKIVATPPDNLKK